MNKNKKKTIAPNLTWLAYGVLVLPLLFSYGYFLNATVNNAVSKEKIENTIAPSLARIQELELARGTLQASVTKDLAHSLGFTDSESRVFLSLSKTDSSVSLRGE